MKQLPFKNKTLTKSQKFFIERSIELLYRQTIDSYRVRIMNPRTITEELLSVSKGFLRGKIKGFRSVESCKVETIDLLKKDQQEGLLKFSLFDYAFLIEFLKEVRENDFGETYPKLKNALKSVIEENGAYCHKLIETLKLHIDRKITEKDDIYRHYLKLNGLTGFLITELIARGYSKSFLFRFFYSLFVYQENKSFEQAFQELTELAEADGKTYRVWFKLNSKKEVVENLNLFGNCKVVNDLQEEIDLDQSPEYKHFQKKMSSTRFIRVEMEACDHYSALRKAKHTIAENLDVLHLGFSFSNSSLVDKALVQDLSNPSQAEFHKVRHYLDGRYKAGQEVFEDLLDKVPEILANPKIVDDTKEKIKSVIRYLRLGNESIEIEHQFINYWIGMEYLFSNFRDSTFTRIKDLLPCMQTIIYVKRNLSEYHRNVKQVQFSTKTTKFDADDINCLENQETYEEVRNLSFEISPLLSFRSWFYKNRLFSESKRKEYIESHQKRLEQHLIRLYRVRNEIVHEARYNFANEGLTSNLKYYLTFSLGVVIDYFHGYSGELTSLEDFFMIQKLKLEYLKKKSYPLETLLSSNENFELLNL